MLEEPIAHGATADIYAWGDKRILKLFVTQQPRGNVEYEYGIAQRVAASGLDVPQVYDMIEHEGRWGIVYERIAGDVLSNVITPDTAGRYGHDVAVLHTTLSTQHIPTLPRQRDRFRERIQRGSLLSDDERQRVLDHLDTLPEDTVLCHGDFHPMNIMQTASGLKIIDWTDATQGHFAADVGRVILIMEEIHAMSDFYAPQLTEETQTVWRTMIQDFLSAYREEMAQRLPDVYALVPRWMPVLAAIRLTESQYTQPSSSDLAAAQQRMIARMQMIVRQVS